MSSTEMTEQEAQQQQQMIDAVLSAPQGHGQPCQIVFMPSSPKQIIYAEYPVGEQADGQSNWVAGDECQTNEDANNESRYALIATVDQVDGNNGNDLVTVPGGGLTPVTHCCIKKVCYSKFAPKVQEDCFNRFWSIKNKSNQNYFLAGLMSAEDPKRVVTNPVRCNKAHSWQYFVDVRGKKVQVCQNFFTGVYGISSSKIQTIQHKLVTGTSLDDLRGKFSKKGKKGNEDDGNELDVTIGGPKRGAKTKKTGHK